MENFIRLRFILVCCLVDSVELFNFAFLPVWQKHEYYGGWLIMSLDGRLFKYKK